MYPKTPKENFFSAFKSNLHSINEANKLRSFSSFMHDINKELNRCRTIHNMARWDEGMFSSAFCQYWFKKSREFPLMSCSHELPEFLKLTHPSHNVFQGRNPTNPRRRVFGNSTKRENSYCEVSFFEICEHRKVHLVPREGIRPLEQLKQILTHPSFYFFMKQNDQKIHDRRLFIHWVRFLAEISVLDITAEMPWPTLINFRQMITQVTSNIENQTLLIHFFNQEIKILKEYLQRPRNPSIVFDSSLLGMGAARSPSPAVMPMAAAHPTIQTPPLRRAISDSSNFYLGDSDDSDDDECVDLLANSNSARVLPQPVLPLLGPNLAKEIVYTTVDAGMGGIRHPHLAPEKTIYAVPMQAAAPARPPSPFFGDYDVPPFPHDPRDPFNALPDMARLKTPVPAPPYQGAPMVVRLPPRNRLDSD
jgi:hypothetical protein